MKRAFPQKVKPVPYCPCEVDDVVEQPKQAASGVKRRARTSAAMIGLALSMGASSLLLPRQNDGAVAAEPQATDTVAAMPLDAQNAASVHVVQQEGQTLWQLARQYQVDAEVIAEANGLSVNAVLQIGQTIDIPAADSQVGHVSTVSTEVSSPETSNESITLDVETAEAEPTASDPMMLAVSADRQLKIEQDEALELMRQKREELRNSLAQLQSEPISEAAAEPEKVQASASLEDSKTHSQRSDSSDQVDAAIDAESLAIETPQVPSQSEAASEAEAPTAQGLTHQVKPGDTLAAIANAYSVSPQALVTANHLSDPDWLRVNQSLVIPQTAAAPEVPTRASVPPASELAAQPSADTLSEADSVVYRVNSGDTLVTIAHRYNVPQMAIVDANNLDNPNLIVVNQELTIPRIEAGEATQSTAIASVPMPSSEGQNLNSATPSAAVVPSDLRLESANSEVTTNVATLNTPQYYTTVSAPTVPAVGGSEIAAVPPSELVDSAAAAQPTAPNTLPVAVSPTTVAPTPNASSTVTVESDSNSGSRPYVDNLMAEILSLRDRYQQDAAQEQLATSEPAVVAVTSTPQPAADPENSESVEAVNPEFRPDAPAAEIQAEVRRLRQQRQSEQARATSPATPADEQATAPATNSSDQRVAVAPLGSESYEPLIQPMTGQVVSPDLPPLSEAEAYLPEGAPTFDGYRWPTRGTVTSGYGWRWGRMHRGIDIGAPTGTPVVAAAAGEVVFSGWNSGGYGNMVDIRHADGSITRYAHNSRLLVREGQQVEQGELISEVGSTGYSTGPHLHFEVRLPNQGTVNPIAYLPQSRN